MNEKQLIEKYGPPGTRQVYAKLPYPMFLAWEPKIVIHRFSCHEVVKDNVESIFKHVLKHYGEDRITELGLDMFGGCFNVRKMRGSSTKLSLHSWGLAIDLDPTNNQFSWGHERARFAGEQYNEFWDIVEANGAYSLGRLKNYDWMHFQFVPVEGR